MKKITAALITLIFIAGVFWSGGFLFFINQTPKEPNYILSKADAIIVLTGDNYRLKEGLSLLKNGIGEKLLITGVYPGVQLKDLVAVNAMEVKDIQCCVEIDYQAETTRGNAIESAKWVSSNQYKSVRLVTSDYHMLRSLIEFKQYMPKVEFIPHPVFQSNIQPKKWWAWPKTTFFMVKEYNKFLISLVRTYL